jgi:hypothetical protein
LSPFTGWLITSTAFEQYGLIAGSIVFRWHAA